jgi:3-dehydroquinate synthase
VQEGKNSLLHGEAIAIGMICEAFLSIEKTGLPADELTEIVATFKHFYGKYPIKEASIPAILEVMKSDKKNTSGKINCSLLTQIGQCTIDSFCTEEELCESLIFYLNC